jgi:hypothetical protein
MRLLLTGAGHMPRVYGAGSGGLRPLNTGRGGWYMR